MIKQSTALLIILLVLVGYNSNTTGQIVAQNNTINQVGLVYINMPIVLAAGTYQLQLTTNKGTTNERLIIQ